MVGSSARDASGWACIVLIPQSANLTLKWEYGICNNNLMDCKVKKFLINYETAYIFTLTLHSAKNAKYGVQRFRGSQ